MWDLVAKPTPDRPGLEALDGFSDTEIYVAGWKGTVAHVQGSLMVQHVAPTSVILADIVCAEDSHVYVCGQNGVLV